MRGLPRPGPGLRHREGPQEVGKTAAPPLAANLAEPSPQQGAAYDVLKGRKGRMIAIQKAPAPQREP
jgi:hypothetical protein